MSVPEDISRLPAEEGRAPNRVRSCSASFNETAAERLTDDLLLEILARAPAKSLCHFRCVSKHWRGLIDRPNLRKRLPRTLAGFLYSSSTSSNIVPETFQQPPALLASVPAESLCPLISTSLAFLPSHGHHRLDVLDCCSGLLLCRSYGVSAQIGESHYLVCNPATEKWVALPNSSHAYHVATARLGFDPAQSSHFHVFELFDDLRICPDSGLHGAAVYSSETGRWVHNKFSQPFRIAYRCSPETVFLNRRLYFHVMRGFDSSKGLAAVDTEVETWTNFGVPGDTQLDAFIQCSQGRVHYATFVVDEDTDEFRLAVYVLENHESKEWTLKHMVGVFYVFGEIDATFVWDFEWVGIHPERNLIFFTMGRGQDTTLKCYEMDFQQVKVICNLKDGKPRYLPYVPLYAELHICHICHMLVLDSSIVCSREQQAWYWQDALNLVLQ